MQNQPQSLTELSSIPAFLGKRIARRQPNIQSEFISNINFRAGSVGVMLFMDHSIVIRYLQKLHSRRE